MPKIENKKTPLIKTIQLSKRYGSSTNFAVEDLSLEIYAGEVYGFLGPNGAGKSTSIRMLMNFLQPTSGTAFILDCDVVKDSLGMRQSVGYLSGDFAAYPKLTGEQFLQYLSELQGNGSMKYAHELAKRLRADLHKRMGDLSRGNRQKIGLIQALMHKPKVLILDEPTSGLDPLMQEEFYKLITEAKQRGAAVFMSSHVLSEVQKICDRVGIIREGKLVAERSMNDMMRTAAHTLDISFTGKVPKSALLKVSGLKIQNSEGSSVTVVLQGKLSDLFKVLSLYDVQSIDRRNLDLEEEFMHYYKKEVQP